MLLLAWDNSCLKLNEIEFLSLENSDNNTFLLSKPKQVINNFLRTYTT